MIHLHYTKGSPKSEALKSRLDALVIRYELEEHRNSAETPFIVEDGRTINNSDEIEQWLQQLEQEINLQRSVSGDGCYIHPKSGKIS